MAEITRFPGGVVDQEAATFGAVYPQLDPAKYVRYFNDFHVYTAGDWTVTETQGGATQAIVAGHGGILKLGNSAADNDLNALQLTQETFKFASGRKAWMRARFKVSDATQSDLMIGLAITDTSPLESLVSDGVYFYKADGAATLSLEVRKDTAASSANIATMVDDTYLKAEMYYDGASTWRVWLNGAEVSSVTSATNMPDDEELAVTIAVQNGAGAAKDLHVDFVEILMER